MQSRKVRIAFKSDAWWNTMFEGLDFKSDGVRSNTWQLSFLNNVTPQSIHAWANARPEIESYRRIRYCLARKMATFTKGMTNKQSVTYGRRFYAEMAKATNSKILPAAERSTLSRALGYPAA